MDLDLGHDFVKNKDTKAHPERCSVGGKKQGSNIEVVSESPMNMNTEKEVGEPSRSKVSRSKNKKGDFRPLDAIR